MEIIREVVYQVVVIVCSIREETSSRQSKNRNRFQGGISRPKVHSPNATLVGVQRTLILLR